MNTPLVEFVCDCCNQKINNPNEGILEWIVEFDSTKKVYISREYKILHHFSKSPNKNINKNGCSIHSNERGLRDTDLNLLLNKDSGMSYIISILDNGKYHMPNYVSTVKDIREYVEIVKRLTIENYDEARLYWNQALSDNFFTDESPVKMYSTSPLINIIQKYAKQP